MNVLFRGGPLNGTTQECDDAAVNVIDDSMLGVVRLVTYRVDQNSGSAYVVAEAVL